jgi:phosphate:Na+ symporter
MLLLWSVRMVRTGVERAYGTQLKAALRRARDGHVRAAAAGAVMAVVLQSATAVGVLAAGFAVTGVLTTGTGIAALVGADLGSALVVKLLSFDLSDLAPLLILVGATLFLKFDARRVRLIGRMVLGVAFVLLSLKMIGDATEPMRDSAALPQMIGWLKGDPLSSFLLAGVLAWMMHSSVATLLLVASLTGNGVLPLEAAGPMVLGANLGGGIIAVWLTRGLPPEARRIPLGNLVVRGVGGVAGLAMLMILDPPLTVLGQTGAGQVVNLHVLFNAALVILSLPLIRPLARLSERLAPTPPQPTTDNDPLGLKISALDRSAIHHPKLALASAKREVLRMGETVAAMFRPVMEVLENGTPDQIERIRQLDAVISRKNTEIKLYIAEVNRGELDKEQAREGLDLIDATINLEQIGDIITKGLMPLAERVAQKNLRFSAEGWAEMSALHARVEANLQMALNLLISADLDLARQLAREKEKMRDMERDSHHKHLDRLRSGKVESIETSDIHLETVRSFKEINSLLVTVSYPILTESGQLLQSRLAQ